MDELTSLRKKISDLEQKNRLFNETEEAGKIGGWQFDPVSLKQNWTDEVFRILEIDLKHGAPEVPKGLEFIDPEYRSMAEKAIQRAMEYGEPYNQEWVVTTHKGNKKWVNAVCNPKMENGKVMTISGSFQDITAKKKAEEESKKSELRLNKVLDSSPFPTAVVDENDQNVMYWSKSAIQLFGHDPKTTQEWYELAYPNPEYRQQVIERWKPFLEIAQQSNKAVNTGEYEISCKDGSVKICELYAQFIPGSLVVTLNDITDRKKSEERLKSLNQQLHANEQQLRAANQQLQANEQQLRATNQQLQASEQQLKFDQETLKRTQKIAHIGSWDWDVASDTVSWSDELFQIFRLDPKKGAVTYADHPSIYTPESMKLLDAAVAHTLETGEPYKMDVEIIRGDGTNAFCSVRGFAKKDEKGKIFQLYGSFQDITERKNSEEQLKSLNQQLQANEQQLRAANQQLQANEQQLKAANQQLQANEQQLKASNQQLQANEQQLKAANQELNANQLYLRDSKETAERYLNIAAEIILSLDSKGNILMLNDSGYQLLGYQKESLIGKDWFSHCLPEKIVGKVKSVFDHLMTGEIENVASYESDIITKTGEIKTILWYNTVLKDKNGNIIGTLSSGEDITEKVKILRELAAREQHLKAANQQLEANEQQLKGINKQLEESESRYKNLVEMASDGIYLISDDGIIIDTNKGAMEMLGKEKDEIVGLNLDSIDPNHHINAFLDFWKDLPFNKQQRFETTHQHKNGNLIPVEISAKKYLQDDETFYYSIARDISERKQAEAELKKIEWLFQPKKEKTEIEVPDYGDLTAINQDGLILNAVGKEMLNKIVGDYLSLLETSAAVYEKNGDYATGIFSSEWCQFLDCSSRALCKSKNNTKALESGKWLCHESCWGDASKQSMQTNKATDIECSGGLHIYAIPIRANGEVIGAINFGYGNPPTDEETLEEIADKYKVSKDKLRDLAHSYETRPAFIIDIAKERLESSAYLIGNIVERKQMEADLISAKEKAEESEKYLDNIIKNIADPIFVKDEESKLLVVNDAFCQLFGLKKEHILGKSLAEEVAPSEQESFLAIDKMVLDNGETNISEESLTVRDGLTKTISTKKSRFLDKTGRKFLIGIIRDITERKQSEIELLQAKEKAEESQANVSAIIEGNNNSIWAFNRNYQLLYINHVFQQEFLQSFGVLLKPGMNLVKALPEALQPFWKPRYDRVLANEQFTLEDAVPTENGTVYIQVSFNPIIKGGEVIGGSCFGSNITSRKLAEIELTEAKEKAEESEKKLLEAQKLSQLGSWEYIIDTDTVIWSKELFNIFERSLDLPAPNYSLQKPFYTEESFAKLDKAIQDCVQREIPYEIELDIILPSGSIKQIISRGDVLKDQNNKVIGSYGTAQDITQRKKTERELIKAKEKAEKSEAILLGEKLFSETLVNSLPGVFYLISDDGRFLRWNKKFEIISGRSAEEMAQVSPIDLFIEDDKKAIAAAIQRVFTHGQVQVRGKIVAKDGKSTPYQFTGDKIMVDGTPHLIGLGLDITEQQQAEIELMASKEKAEEIAADLKLAQKIANIGNWHFDPELGYPVWSDHVFNIYERNPEDGVPHIDDYKTIYEPDQYEIFIKAFTAAINEGKSYDIELKLLLPKDRIKWVRAICRPDLNRKSKSGYFLSGTIQDISLSKKIESELQIAKEKAEAANIHKNYFLANMSHEIRTPMNGVLGFTNILLEEDFSAEERTKYLHIIERNSQQLLALIDDIIDVAKIESKELKIDFDKCKISEIFNDLEENFNQIKLRLNKEQILLKMEIPPKHQELVINTDAHRLRQVISNLINNAIKFSEKGSITFGFNVKKSFVEFYVSDQGIGIPQEKLTEIFERFKQLNYKNAAKYGGTGLGLAISKGIINKLGGTISVKSEPNIGSTFSFKLPINANVKVQETDTTL